MYNYDDYNLNMQNELMSTMVNNVYEYLRKEIKGDIVVEYCDMVLMVTIMNIGHEYYTEVDLSTGLYARNDLSSGIARWIIKIYKEHILSMFFVERRY